MELKEILNGQQGTVIDVRNAFELAEGAVPGAINIPVDRIPQQVPEIKNMKGPLLLYCRSGNRSSMAIAMLKAAGVKTEMINGGGYQDLLNILN